MNKLPCRNLFVAAALFGFAAESTWSEEATSGVPAAPAEQTASPGAGSDPGYAQSPYQGGYEPYWQPPPRPAPPPGYYGHYPPYYPTQPQYRTTPAAPAENPHSAELKQAQEQLAAKNSELDAANEQVTTLQSEQQAMREVMLQALAETAKASEQLSVVVEEMDILYEVLSKLKAGLDTQNISLQGAVEAGAEENDKVDSAVAGGAEQAQSPTTLSDQPESGGGEHTGAGDNEPTKPEAE